MSAMTNQIWIRSAHFDLTFVMGGAVLTLLLPVLTALRPELLPLVFWIWLIGFEGSHFWATFSRTYFDARFRDENSGLLLGSLVFFAFPAVAVLLRSTTKSAWSTDLYGYFIFLWSLYHNARQHFGFLSIYARKSGNSNEIVAAYQRVIYLAIAGAQIYFAAHFKTELAIPVAPFHQWPAAAQVLLTYGPLAITSVAAIWLVILTRQSYAKSGKTALIPALYTAVCLVFYSVMFYVVAPREPFFSSPVNGAQKLMLLAVMNSLFHNIQYHAIVWHYSAKRYRSNEQFGLAGRFNRATASYLGVALSMGVVFGLIVWNMHDWPWITGTYTPGAEFPTVPYILFFGIIGHHFYLDQRIWRPSRQHDLRLYLGLSPVPAS
jgi:hypothetical protein